MSASLLSMSFSSFLIAPLRAVAQVVPTYHDPDEVNQSAEHADEMKLAGATV